MTKPVVRLFS